MSVNPTGERGKAKLNLVNLLAESATFQTAIGATGTSAEKIAAAKLRLHRAAYAPDEITGFVRPFGLICSVDQDEADSIAIQEFAVGGEMELRFERDINSQHINDPQMSETDFENFYEAVLADAMTLSAQPGYFVINNWKIIEGPARFQDGESSQKWVYGVRILISWGLA
jgi:hypothetical protein